MKINQVAELVGITSKNIRFYEAQGLIKPRRDPQNGYREYTIEDAKQLERIRLLRQLGFSCEKIRQLQGGEFGFDRCMAERIEELGREGENIGHMQSICRMLSEEVDNVEELDASVYLERMQDLERGGVTFMNVKKSDVKKRRTGAILAGGVVILFMTLLIALILWANRDDPAPPGVLVTCLIVFGGIIIGVVIALRQRLDEVKKGEIDEASEY
ncbi:MAG: MerR family transcriptional regulator [Mogibacterium sp.]|nr:MerR family transcriptional regulator [Mogibacterium sp.]